MRRRPKASVGLGPDRWAPASVCVGTVASWLVLVVVLLGAGTASAVVASPVGARTTAVAAGATDSDGAPGPVEGEPDRLVDDPTSDGQVTARTLHLLELTRARFPVTSWRCHAPRPGTVSDHPLGRACDGTFGNALGERPTPEQHALGWQVADWMKEHARTLGVQYVIWDGLIWSPRRDAEGWRPYDGGGLHDAEDVTGGHFDHLHVSVREGELSAPFAGLGDLAPFGDLDGAAVRLLGAGLVVTAVVVVVSRSRRRTRSAAG